MILPRINHMPYPYGYPEALDAITYLRQTIHHTCAVVPELGAYPQTMHIVYVASELIEHGSLQAWLRVACEDYLMLSEELVGRLYNTLLRPEYHVEALFIGDEATLGDTRIIYSRERVFFGSSPTATRFRELTRSIVEGSSCPR